MSLPQTIDITGCDIEECGPCPERVRVLIVSDGRVERETELTLDRASKMLSMPWTYDIPVRLTHNMILPDDPRVVPTTRQILAAHGLLR